tara:strand:+ start:173 stop:463 length:291 start_codon:yes stop_codon:yes gene_type:complete
MRKITIDAIRALRNGTNFKRGNTKVVHHYDEAHLLLHGHLIAFYSEHGGLFISSAGHHTMTTKERLNGLPNVNIHQKNFQWFLNGEEWDGQFIKVE